LLFSTWGRNQGSNHALSNRCRHCRRNIPKFLPWDWISYV